MIHINTHIMGKAAGYKAKITGLQRHGIHRMLNEDKREWCNVSALCDTLGEDAEREMEEGHILSCKELAKTDVVRDESGDNTENAPSLGDTKKDVVSCLF